MFGKKHRVYICFTRDIAIVNMMTDEWQWDVVMMTKMVAARKQRREVQKMTKR